MGEYHAFSERIGQEVGLRPLTDDQLHTLVSHYLVNGRGDAQDGISPFTDKSLSVILQHSQGNIRQALGICSRVLDSAVDNGMEEITAEFVQETIQ